ncbi:MAG: hypothetical protein HOG03_24695 [Desulfobacula sp.]|jgi:PhoH-like ATPase|uniref:PIN domain-containing protein n=1 Tax=Desulfobacula sp. TaxID=2593537 RepID=UPI001EBA8E7C|nr:hypothetical protein [Desulfobacula sp.]MBT4876890.1 hypothetical protein [Desulfobacula sp.]MBT5546458.1 hypothetical protein [Desulfobacula sp.]MBT5972727.1 hypothetical protein [Desulfobacula sp.]MBT7794521.1 hypothetical protein [Desulfobacula sp.]
MKKTFVLDTNVILHDSTCIYQFGDHDIIIPITVIEELDRFKKGNRIVRRSAIRQERQTLPDRNLYTFLIKS